MKYLMIDTSTDTMVLILSQDGRTLDATYRVGKSDHQAFIIPLIDDILKKNKWTLKKLDGIIIGVGPGSYTGLRVGVMTAKMLAYASNIKLYKISSLLFLTSGYQEEKLVWHDARNHLGFSGGYLNGFITKEEKIRNYDELSGFELNQLVILKESTIKIDSAIILKYMVLVEDIKALVPNYLRKTEAEVKLDKKS